LQKRKFSVAIIYKTIQNNEEKNKGLFLVALFLSGIAQAQLTKGNWLVGGNASYSSTQSENAASTTTTNRKSLTAEPDIGYFFFDKFAVG